MRYYTKILVLLIFISFVEQSSKACYCSDILTIDSLAQLKEYDFIAHVKIMDDEILKNPSKNNNYETIGQLTFQVLELFKGEKINKILEYSKESSCDIGISIGEEWILFGKTVKGRLSVVPCDRNKQYKEKDGQRDWKYGQGFLTLKKLKKLYEHPINKFENGKRKEFYVNGEVEIEENYINGKLNGERKIWYSNGKLFCRQFYTNDTLNGKSEWFYQSGQIYDEDYYMKGIPCNVSRLYYDSANSYSILNGGFYESEDSLKFVYNRVQIHYENIFDSYGQAIISREYTRFGKIHREEIIDPDKKFKTVIYYHDNGAIASIMYLLNGVNFGHYQTYDKNGFPSRGWDYDENGKAILNK